MPGPPDRQLWHPASIPGRLVVLRHFRRQDLPSVLRWYRDPELARLTRYQTRPMTREEVERFFDYRLMAPDSLAYAIHVRDIDRLIGLTTFSSLDPENSSALFHITIGERDAWERGYGTDATGVMLEHAFQRLALHRVALSVFSFNARAIRAYEKSGFRVEGRLREAIWRDDRYWDEVQMGALRDDWIEARAAQGFAEPEEVEAGIAALSA